MAKISLSRPLVLALDLDETFAAGEASDRQDLLDLLDGSREQAHLVYMSHDSADNLIRLAAGATLPVPDVFMADSGTTVLMGDGSGTIEPLQRNIIQLWPGKDAVGRMAATLEDVEMLEDNAPCRQALSYKTDEQLEEVRAKADEIGCHAQLRRNHRVEILPYGVDKGSTLGRWIVQENHSPNHVLAYGSTLGDVSLFGRGWRGVCFPHAPEEMLAEANRFHNVHIAKANGPKGVIEGLRHFGWLEMSGVA